MKLINKGGTYRGPIVEHGLGVTTTGLPKWIALLQATEVYDFATNQWMPFQDENCDVTAHLCLFSGKQEPTFHVQNIMHAVEWDGKSLAGLSKLELTDVGVQFSVAIENYKDKDGPNVKRLVHFDDTPQTGGVNKLNDSDVASLSASFDALLKKSAAPAKAVSAPASAPASKPTPMPEKPKAAKGKKPAPPPAPEPEPEAAPEPESVSAEEFEADLPVGNDPDPAVESAAAETPPAAKPGPKAPATPKGMTKAEAWSHVIQFKAKNVTVAEVTKSWQIAVRAAGKAEAAMTPADWATVCETVCNEHGVF